VDVTLTGFGDEQVFVSAIFSSGYRARISDAAEFALKNRVLLVESPHGIAIDIALGALPYEELVVQRSTPYEFERIAPRTCSAEDLIVLKLFAFRPRDVLDVETVDKHRRQRCL
jgi:hypothetical protein